ncbi:MAG: GNAT family N-acetyltransferase [Rhodospirillales bacterium]
MTNIPDVVLFRFANRNDVPTIAALLADDVLGLEREDTGGQNGDVYLKAFDDMEAQGGNHYLLAVHGDDDTILGCLQIILIPGLSRTGMKRAQVEGVRVAKTARRLGIGNLLMAEVHKIALEESCGLVQLTTDHSRADTLRFYEGLGYENTHHGLKASL